MKLTRRVLTHVIALLLSAAAVVIATPAHAASGGAALSGTYENFFQHIGKTQAETDQKVQDLYNAIYTENGPADQRIYYPVGSDMAYILSTHDGDVRSEGMSYALMVALQMNDRSRFDKLWKFSKTYMQCPNVNTDCGGRYDGLFIWHVDDQAPYGHFTLPSGEPEYTPAPDGDVYFATALLMASARWGDGSGIFDYRSQASSILNELKDTSDLQSGELSVFNPDNKLVRFIPTWVEGSGSLVDTSYQLPGFYEYWSRNDPTTSNRTYWNEAAGAARAYWRQVLDKAGNQGNGIFPDCTKQDGGPLDQYSCASGYKQGADGWRTIQNVAFDYYWYNGDSDGQAPLAEERTWADQLLGFMRPRRTSMAGEWYVNGTPASDWTGGAGQALMYASAATVVTDTATRDDFLRLAWDYPVTTGEWRYYHSSLHMLGMLHLAGKYKAYDIGGQQPAGTAVYTDGLAPGWRAEAWNGTVDTAASTPAYGGSGTSVKMTPGSGWDALSFASSSPVTTGGISRVVLRVHGGDSGTRQLQLMINPAADGSGTWGTRVPLDAPAGTWTQFSVPLSDLGSPATIGAIALQDRTGQVAPAFNVDDVRLA
ncbi:glycosyl hydrolase family 8 [Streptomyces longwoodensis]|uniref:glycosyl hydrolase family 8 n=1 Tax=Streptomyces longwoodensis TaxID=68231 RepID=UPI0033C146D7